ncbi:hypothetical protein HOY82DRAFT_536819 [Tuber indicum]|nr:hypothetical protein HOY82DRAFT_536819 [Tuber indicum]
MGNLCFRGEHIRESAAEAVELRSGLARLERGRGDIETRASTRRATARGGGGGGGNPMSIQTSATRGGGRVAGHNARPEGSRNFRVLEELEARKRKTRKAERDRS